MSALAVNSGTSSHSRTSILERDAFRVVFLEPCFRSVHISKHLDMIGITELLHCINIDPDFDRTSCRPSGAECANRSNAIWYLSTRVTG